MHYSRNLTKLTKMAKLTKKMVKEAIVGSAGIVSLVAKRCNVSRQAMSKYFEKHDSFKELLIQEKESLLDLAECKIINLIQTGDTKVVQWFLERKGKVRDYGDKQELDLLESPRLVVNIEKTFHGEDENKGKTLND